MNPIIALCTLSLVLSFSVVASPTGGSNPDRCGTDRPRPPKGSVVLQGDGCDTNRPGPKPRG